MLLPQLHHSVNVLHTKTTTASSPTFDVELLRE